MVVEDKCEIICVPSAFALGTGKFHWHTLIRTRAIENQCFIFAPNQCRTAPNGFKSFGHSMIVDPWGEIIAEADGENESIIYANIDTSKTKHDKNFNFAFPYENRIWQFHRSKS